LTSPKNTSAPSLAALILLCAAPAHSVLGVVVVWGLAVRTRRPAAASDGAEPAPAGCVARPAEASS
jgi:hypothetical protein